MSGDEAGFFVTSAEKAYRAILNRILSGDPEAADRAMREHIRDSYAPFMEAFGDERI